MPAGGSSDVAVMSLRDGTTHTLQGDAHQVLSTCSYEGPAGPGLVVCGTSEGSMVLWERTQCPDQDQGCSPGPGPGRGPGLGLDSVCAQAMSRAASGTGGGGVEPGSHLRHTFRRLHVRSGPGSPLHSLSFCGAGRLASGDGAGTVRLFDVGPTGLQQLGGGLAGHKDSVLSLAACQDSGQVLLSGSLDGTLRLWDIRSAAGCVRTIAVSPGHAQGVSSPAVFCVAMCAQGRSAVSGSHGQDTLRVWDLGSGRAVAALQAGAQHYQHPRRVLVDAAFTTALSCGPGEAEVLVWDLSRGRLCATHTWGGKKVRELCASADLSSIAVAVAAVVEDGLYDRYDVRAWLPSTHCS